MGLILAQLLSSGLANQMHQAEYLIALLCNVVLILLFSLHAETQEHVFRCHDD